MNQNWPVRNHWVAILAHTWIKISWRRTRCAKPLVAILAHAWIKICNPRTAGKLCYVAILAHAWIEITRLTSTPNRPVITILAHVWIKIPCPWTPILPGQCCNPRVYMNWNTSCLYLSRWHYVAILAHTWIKTNHGAKPTLFPVFRCNPRACMNWNSTGRNNPLGYPVLQFSHTHELKCLWRVRGRIWGCCNPRACMNWNMKHSKNAQPLHCNPCTYVN